MEVTRESTTFCTTFSNIGCKVAPKNEGVCMEIEGVATGEDCASLACVEDALVLEGALDCPKPSLKEILIRLR